MINYLNSCKGKYRHSSMGKAEAAIRALDKVGRLKDDEEMSAYFCGFCRGYHIGHKIGSGKEKSIMIGFEERNYEWKIPAEDQIKNAKKQPPGVCDPARYHFWQWRVLSGHGRPTPPIDALCACGMYQIVDVEGNVRPIGGTPPDITNPAERNAALAHSGLHDYGAEGKKF